MLACPQRVVACPCVVSADVAPARPCDGTSIVCLQYDDRVVQHALSPERRSHIAHALIHTGEHTSESLSLGVSGDGLLVGLDIAIGHLVGRVHGLVC